METEIRYGITGVSKNGPSHKFHEVLKVTITRRP